MNDQFKFTATLCEAALFTAAVGGGVLGGFLMGIKPKWDLVVLGSAAAAASVGIEIIKMEAVREEQLKLTEDKQQSNKAVVGKFTGELSEKSKNESSVAFLR